ncbi:glycoside hydrolase family 3 C-terminal domain-containing protein [Promicromonospora sukumoe]|uniref:Exo-alpha-(1->6)-L-arabinopyranosidase n=1 Tax=Promicromonospora sukumoe TaxID=88382 RepID=A0A7W3JCZ9_9MICO|nr:glycoside hydrolase family 3 C-terminal domain-containing protein [Promicromonospora sukumoe]MBA8810587.1 beta-glucosidase [Promicromonospora sukumoe]
MTKQSRARSGATGAAPADPAAVVRRLTLEQKARLLSGASFWSTAEAPGVPSVYLADGPHGVRRLAPDVGDIEGALPATCFPPAVALGSTFDVGLVARVGAAVAAEARERGVDVVLGPGVNIKRSPLCGRNFEYVAEDPLLAGEIGAALVTGLQGGGVAASVKHFAANNQETERMRVSADIDERTLREIYLRAFQRVVTRARPATLMTSYNRVNGTHTGEDRRLATHVLRGEWGFEGLVMSDWGAVHDRLAGIRAGLDLEMPGASELRVREIVAAVRSGDLDVADVDRSAARVVALALAARERRAEGASSSASGAGAVLGSGPSTSEASLAERGDDPEAWHDAAHHALAREVASRAIVLLKNDGGLLPLAPRTRLAVIGELARTPRYQGSGSSQIVPTRLDDALAAIRDSATDVVFAAGYGLGSGGRRDAAGAARRTGATGRRSALSVLSVLGAVGRKGVGRTGSVGAVGALADEAVAAARDAGVVLFFAGLPQSAEAEGRDREHIDLPDDQLDLLDRVLAVNPRVVVVLSNGSVVRLSGFADRVPAIVEGWLLGQAGGGAMADVLFGRVNPSGRLAETVPLRLQDTPAWTSFPGTGLRVTYGEGIFVGYRWYDARDMDVQYPFGHGLSYTTFGYSGLVVSTGSTRGVGGAGPGAVGGLAVQVTVTNTGGAAGREVVQCYVSLPGSTVPRAPRALAAFAVVDLAPGESREVELVVDRDDLAYWDVRAGRWHVEGGAYRVEVGASSRDLRVTAEVEVAGDVVTAPLTPESSVGEAMAHPVVGPVVTALLKATGLSDDVMIMTRAMPLERLPYQPGSGVTHRRLRRLLDVANGTGGPLSRAAGRLLTLPPRLRPPRKR